MSCRRKECDEKALYAEVGENKPRYCEEHKKKGYVLVYKSDKKKAKKLKADTESDSESEKEQTKKVGLVIDSDSDSNTNLANYNLDIFDKKQKIKKGKVVEENDEEGDVDADTDGTKAGKKWTDDDIAKLLECAGKNKSNADIGKAIGRTERAVFCKKQQLSFEMLKEKDIEAVVKLVGLTKSEIEYAKGKFEYQQNKKEADKKIKADTKGNAKGTQSNSLTDSILLVEKINEMIDKNMANFKLTGKSIISEKIVDELLKEIKTK